MSTDVTAPSRRRSLWGWAAVVLAIVVVGLVGTALAGDEWTQRGALDPASAGPSGTRALVQLLADQGIDVRVARDRDEALNTLDDQSTLVLPDAPALSDSAVSELAAAAGDVVLIEPRSRTLRLLLAGSSPSGVAGPGEREPACDIPAAERAGGIVGGVLADPGDGVTGCYPSGDEGFALLTTTAGERTVSAIDGRAVFANDVLAQGGNASLALALTGSQPSVVWYMPSLDDADTAAAPTLGELTPEWVTPVMLLLVASAVAAALWRGRRFGPLVAETLPVTVRASETTVGRAHLYAQSRDAAHALDQLRLGAIDRIAGTLGLAGHAGSAAVADAIADLLSADRASVRGILIDQAPRSDRELVELAVQLRELEARVSVAARPERKTP